MEVLMPKPSLFLTIIAVLSLSACGGSGGSDNNIPKLFDTSGSIGDFDTTGDTEDLDKSGDTEDFDPSGSNEEIARSLRNSFDINMESINFKYTEKDISAAGAPPDIINFEIVESGSDNKIQIKVTRKDTSETGSRTYSINRRSVEHDVAIIDFIDEGYIVMSGLLFPFGFSFGESTYTNLNRGIDLGGSPVKPFITIGQALKLAANTNFPKNQRITFGREKTRTFGTYIYYYTAKDDNGSVTDATGNEGNPTLEDIFQLKLELEYLAYDDTASDMHEVRINFTSFNFGTDLTPYNLTKSNLEEFKLYKKINDASELSAPTNKIFFSSDEYISFRLSNRALADADMDEYVPLGSALHDLSATFDLTAFGTDVNNLFLAGNYKILINNENINTGRIQDLPPNSGNYTYYFGVFVLPKL